MSAAPNLDPIFRVIEGGLEVAKDSTTEVIADNGAKIVDIFTREAVAGNGTTAEVAEIVNIAEGASTGTTEGVALLTQPIQGVAVPAIAVGLGTVAGVALGNVLYELSPTFWANLSDALFEAGATVQGKVVAFMDNTGKTSYPQDVIEIVKNALLQEGLFSSQFTPTTSIDTTKTLRTSGYSFDVTPQYYNQIGFGVLTSPTLQSGSSDIYDNCYAVITQNGQELSGTQTSRFIAYRRNGNTLEICPVHPNISIPTSGYLSEVVKGVSRTSGQLENVYGGANQASRFTYTLDGTSESRIGLFFTLTADYFISNYSNLITPNLIPGTTGYTKAYDLMGTETPPEHVQDGATLPTGDPFPTTYPSWQPASKPTTPVTYPVSQPSPNGTQPQTQTGLNPDPAQQGELSDYFYAPEPMPAPEIQPDPSPQPQPQPEPMPEPAPTPETDPGDPNPDPEGSGSTPVLPPVATTPSSALFTVYNPTDGELDSLGSFLWSNSIIDQLKKIWQNPLDGIIALHKVYATPSTGGTQNIILGYVDSEVSASVVTGQFVTVDCGSVTVPENKQNATDYSPFTQLQIYLPFVGIQELDTNEIMNGSVNVKYKIDMYTGTCLAMVFITRSPDKENAQLLYTFSGNCSQQIPLTSSNFSGAIASLLGIVGVGVASGGALGAVAGMGAIAHSLTHEMVHIQHSGGLSANSGILAPRKPFIIISRQYGYDANNYNQIYGFPANKTVYLSNCKDFVRVKAMNYKGKGTQEEKQMIVDQLKRGVII